MRFLKIPTKHDKLNFFWGVVVPTTLFLLTLGGAAGCIYFLEFNKDLVAAFAFATVSMNASITFFALKRHICGRITDDYPY